MQPAQDEGVVFGGHFRAKRRVKSILSVESSIGEDVRSGAEVLIKTAPVTSLPPGTRKRLAHEASVLRRMKAGTVAPLLAVGEDQGRVYSVGAFVPGTPLDEHLVKGTPSVLDAIAIGRAVLTALKEVHEHGVVHRDVKPSNIVIPREGPRAVLVDFGISRWARVDPRVRLEDVPVASVRYRSPEQSGLIGRGVDERSDLYAFGVVLYECLAGRPPFSASSIGDLLREHLSAHPPEIAGVPRALSEVVGRLLRKDPRDRYQSAEAVLQDLGEIERALAEGKAEPAIAIGARDDRAALTEPAFLGRARELSRLLEVLALAREGRGALALVEGEAGAGKTRLLDELAQRAVQRGAWVLRGHAPDHVARRPLEILEGVGVELAHAMRSGASTIAALAQAVEREHGGLGAAMPELAGLITAAPAPAKAPSVHPDDPGEPRALRALTHLLAVLGTPDRPALVILDDCQWADDLGVRLLDRWQAHVERPERLVHVLVVAAFRSEDVPADHPLRAIVPSTAIELAPLPAEEMKRLLESMAGAVPEEVIELSMRLADGNPEQGVAALQGLVEGGALVRTGAGWRASKEALEEVQAPKRAAALLSRRLDLLPENGLRLLSIGALLGREFDLELAANLAGIDPGTALGLAEQARKRHIVWSLHGGSRYAIAHDQVRDALRERIDPEEQRALHKAAAKELEAHHKDRAFELAYHWDAGGEPLRALPYALIAAEDARGRAAFEVAERNFNIALRGSEAKQDTPGIQRALEGLGEVRLLRGRYSEAARALTAAAELAREPLEQAEIAGKLADIDFKRGGTSDALAGTEKALALLGRHVPRTRAGLWLGVASQLWTRAWRSFFPPRRRPHDRQALLASRLLGRLAYACFFERGMLPAMWASLEELAIAESYEDSAELGQACANHGVAMMLVPWPPRALAYAVRGREIRKQVGDRWGEAQSLHFEGLAHYAAGRLELARERFRAAEEDLARTGDRWETHIARYHHAMCLYRLGDAKAALGEAKRLHQAGVELGDSHARAAALEVWAKASGGRMPIDLIETELLSRRADPLTSHLLHQAKAIVFLAEGRHVEAIESLERAMGIAEDSGLTRYPHVIPALAWHVTALRVRLETLTPFAARKRRRLLRTAERAAVRAVRATRLFPIERPRALREAALVAALRGEPAQARAWLAESIAAAKAQGSKLELSLSIAERRRVGASLGWKIREEPGEETTELGMGVPKPPSYGETPAYGAEVALSLKDRFATLLDAGRRIVTALSRDAVFAAAEEAAKTLLRGERASVVDRIPEAEAPKPTEVTADLMPIQHPAVVLRAVASGRPQLFDEPSAEADGDADFGRSVRSGLLAPIFVRGKPFAYLLVTHAQVAGLFGEEESQIAEFVCALAGAALENAEGIAKTEALLRRLRETQAELEELNRDLEKRVKQRTRESETRAAALERVNAELEHLTWVASHELQAPVRVLTSYVQLLARRYQGALDAQADEFIAFTLEATAQMQKQIQGLLAYSRIGTHGQPFERVLLDGVLDQVLRSLRYEIEDHGAEVTRAALPEVIGERAQLVTLFQSLIGNALKFRSEARPVVQVGVESEEREWVFSVKDNGIGIDPGAEQRIFKIFQRLHSDERYPGLGIGLAVAKRIVERHRGRIWVESKPGEGSTFFFSLPKPGVSSQSGESPLSVRSV